MRNSQYFHGITGVLAPLVMPLTLLFPALLRGEGLAREALSSFSDDTTQLVYIKLAELRSSSAYPQIRDRLLSREFRSFLDFLHSMQIDPDKDVDEVVLGWRGSAEAANFFGLAAGRFQPDQARALFAQKQLSSRQYGGVDLYAFGSGRDSADIFFGFLDSSRAAFGQLADLAALLDARSGTRPALDSNSKLVGWEAELEGSAPQWGIMRGKAVANIAASWLTGGAKVALDPSAVLGPLQAALYQVTWDKGFSARVSILCDSADTASALAQVLTLWRDSQRSPAAGTSSGSLPSFRDLDVDTDGSRVELTASGSMETLDSVLRGPTSGGAR